MPRPASPSSTLAAPSPTAPRFRRAAKTGSTRLLERSVDVMRFAWLRDGAFVAAFYGSGEWPLLSALLGWHYAEVGRIEDARAQLEWVAPKAGSEGHLPKQVDDLLVPSARAESVEPWRPPASPLLWSHALFLTLALRLGARPPARRGTVTA